MTPETSVEDRLQSLLSRSGDKTDFPATARVIQQLHATVRKENCAAVDVVRLVLKDPGLSSKVLQVVNSAFYRKQATPISTITRAVIILGFETIRDVATGLLLLDELVSRGQSSDYIREGLRRSLYCGLLAQALSTKVGYQTPEEAYLLGLFSDWGMLWSAVHFPDEFQRAQTTSRTEHLPLADAVEDVLGVPPAALAATILERWKFPASFAEYFRVPESRERLDGTPGGVLRAVVSLAADFTSPQAGNGATMGAEVLKRFQTLFDGGPKPFLEAASMARDAFREQAPLFGLGPVDDEEDAEASGEPAEPQAPRGDPQAALGIIAEITRAILEQADLTDTLSMVLEGLARGGGYDTVFFALKNAQRDHLDGRLGYGDAVAGHLGELHVPLTPDGGVLADVVLQARPALVTHGTPAPVLRDVRSYVAGPVIVRGRGVGVLVGARTAGPPVSDADIGTLTLFCGQAGLALDRGAG